MTSDSRDSPDPTLHEHAVYCRGCLADNAPGARFCSHCGEMLITQCPACGSENDVDAATCVRCSTTLPARAVTKDAETAEPAGARPSLDNGESDQLERRPLTIMFCDLVGSTQMSGRLDPEEYSEVLIAYREMCFSIVRRFGGFVARYVGDSVLVYFGYPQARDDDCAGAVYAALNISSEMRSLSIQLAHHLEEPLLTHIGIHTGEVIAGELGQGESRERAAVIGVTPNIAARLEAVAGPGEIVISDAIYRQVQGLFECVDLGLLDLKGVASPMHAFRVVSERSALPNFELFDIRHAMPAFGRDEELGMLLKQWERAKEGFGQVGLISGEAGIGKTRLLQEFAAKVGGEPCALLTCQCSPFFSNSAFFPLLDLLRREMKLNHELSAADIAARLESEFDSGSLPQREAMPVIASMLSNSLPRLQEAKDTPQNQRERIVEWLMLWIMGRSKQHPLIMMVEDLHWADASTIEFLTLLFDQFSSARAFMLLTFRSEFRPPWPIRSHVNHFTLTRLSTQHVRSIVTGLTKGDDLPAPLFEQVVAKTDGVPLFVEELTKMVIEFRNLQPRLPGSAVPESIPSIDVPATLHGSLVARLDRIPAAKGIAQLAAVIGREISYKLILAVSGLEESSLRQKLALLVDAELLFQRGIPPSAIYTFKHSLILDAAYQSLLKTKRAQLHGRTAAALLEQLPAVAESHPELVAHHLSEAGSYEQAVSYWLAAGKRALEASANVEAAAHLQRGLRELAMLPGGASRDGREVALQIALGTALTATQGYGATVVERTYARALALCKNLGDSEQLFTALTGLHTFYQVRGPLKIARDIAGQLVELAQTSGDDQLRAQAHRRLGWTLYCLGEARSGKVHLDKVLALYAPEQSHSHAILYGAHPWVVGFVNSAWLEWTVGAPETGLERSRMALSLARELGRPLLLAYALCMSAAMHQCRGEPEKTLELANEAVALAIDKSMPYWIAWGTTLEGWAMAELGRGDEGTQRLREGLEAYRQTGAELFRPYSLALLADACRKTGRHDEALKYLSEALESTHRQDAHFYTAEIYRLRGEVLSLDGKDDPGAEAAYVESMRVAENQGALSFEISAALGLAALLIKQGRATEIGTTLARTVAKFAASADSAHLQKARALLAGTS